LHTALLKYSIIQCCAAEYPNDYLCKIIQVIVTINNFQYAPHNKSYPDTDRTYQ
jgi:hypothetical protein